MTQHVNLVIATPGHSVTADYLKSLLPTIQRLDELGISWAFANGYSSHVGDAREITLNGSPSHNPKEQRPFSGEMSYDKILWIDSDISWTPQDAVKLYQSDYDIVTGAYLLQNGEATVYRKIFNPGMSVQEVLGLTEPIQIAGAGMGFMCVKSGIFENFSRPWFQSVMHSGQLDDGTEFSIPILGEDLSFCKRASNAGHEIWLDPSVRVIHTKTVKLTWEGVKP